MDIVRSKSPILFFSSKEKNQIVSAVQEAEKSTSGEIRIHLERKIKQDPLRHAKQVFEKIGMTKTQSRNGVLIFLGVQSRRFVILGDEGINEKVPDNFWDDIASDMISHFKEDRFAEGITDAVIKIGQKLSEHFPYKHDDINELSNEISYSA